jgi:hypothetical protein
MPEAGTRLTKQLGLLGRFVALIDGASEVDDAAFELVKRVAFDTASGFHLEIVESIMESGGRSTKTDVAEAMRLPRSTIDRRFADLEILGAVVRTARMKETGFRGVKPLLWKINGKVGAMWRQTRKEGEECPPKKSKKRIVVRRRKKQARDVVARSS